MKKLLCLIFLSALTVQAEPIQHCFLAKGESRAQLHYVDQLDPANDWDIQLPRNCRDIQLIDGNRILISHSDGYLEYDLTTQKKIKQVTAKKGAQIESAIRLPNGHTVLAGRKNCITFYELDENDKLLRKKAFKQYGNIRLFRFSPEGHFLFGANSNHVVETDWDGHIYADFIVPGSKHIYWVKKLNDGKKYRVSTGYGKSIVDITTDGKILRTIGGADDYFFFSRPFELPNGNIVCSNWTGHKANDSTKGPQIIEFAPKGNMVWQWHAPERAGTIHGVIIIK